MIDPKFDIKVDRRQVATCLVLKIYPLASKCWKHKREGVSLPLHSYAKIGLLPSD